MLKTIAEYPTSTTICIITNQPSMLAEALRDHPHVKTCGNTHNLSHPWHLTWVHRGVMEAAFTEGEASE